MAKRLFLNTHLKKLKTLKKTTALRRFRTLLLRSTSARQTHFNTTERNHCLLKTWARQITKCLRNDKHALACEQAAKSRESRTRKETRVEREGEKKRPQDNNCYWPLILIKLPFLKKKLENVDLFREFLNYKMAGTSCYIFLLFFFVTWHVHGFCFGDSRFP